MNHDQGMITRRQAHTSADYGEDPAMRSIKDLLNCGVVVIDKPAGPSSHQVSAYVRDLFRTEKAGHSGTLDPKVTGVLPVAIGRGTRIVGSLLNAGKEYVCLMALHADCPKDKIKKSFEKFLGEIEQMPPVRSAVKRQLRKRTIYDLEIIQIKDRLILFRASTQAGTYIRKLCFDIGKDLRVGAHMAELRRTRAGPFREDVCVTLQDLADALHFHEQGDDSHLKKIIFPIESAVAHLPKVYVTDTAVSSLCHGAFLNMPGVASFSNNINPGDRVAVMTLKGELIMVGIAQIGSEKAQTSEKGLFVRPDQVFLDPGVYPKIRT